MAGTRWCPGRLTPTSPTALARTQTPLGEHSGEAGPVPTPLCTPTACLGAGLAPPRAASTGPQQSEEMHAVMLCHDRLPQDSEARGGDGRAPAKVLPPTIR